ncbi:uncharacterized protein LOC121370341 [Gigantopelta aegis]|uniref:uncharacterized protein LOC121370341 n=1 Tax=Gigantopelta aegis TaxID=1735272 RepID=UPI001B88B799|nr:uncharacterized protein LOC121370341 [Gigantopelta aegis]
MMPATIAPIELTRAYSVKAAKGLRYGNFEGVVHLPPVTVSQSLGEHSFSQLNNQQIYKTICDWFQAWQPWQQDLLLCGIANRCSPRQLDILATTLEPLRHRDYSTVCKKQYSSDSFKKGVLPKTIPLKTLACRRSDVDTLWEGQIDLKSGSGHFGTSGSHISINQASSKSRSGLLRKKQCLPSRDYSGKPAGTNMFASKPRSDENKESFLVVSDSLDKPKSSGSRKTLTVDGADGKPKSEKERYVSSALETKQEVKENIPPSTIDEYSNSLALDIIQSAIQTIVVAHVYDKAQTQTLRENTAAENVQTDKKTRKPKRSTASRSGVSIPCSKTNISSSKSHQKTEKSRASTATMSASFLGGMLELKSESSKGLLSGLNSASSQFRHSAFNSSTVSTAGFFSPHKLERFGSPLREMRHSSDCHPVGLSALPITLTKTFQHRKWWRGASLSGSQHAFRKPNKKELSSNFQDQLEHVWEWLHQWEDFERIALLKEVVKITSPCILASLVSHIHQKLRDRFDINRFPDKLLLFILSFLTPGDINVASQVCRRWRFLTTSDELWMLKCLEMGEMEGIQNIPKLVLDAGKFDRLVDWKQAFYELRYLIHTMKERLSIPTDINIDALSMFEDTPAPVEITVSVPEESEKRRASCRITELNLQRGTLSYIQLADAESKKDELKTLAVDEVDRASDDDVSLDEDLSHLLGEYALMQGAEESESPEKYYYRRRRKISQKKVISADSPEQSFVTEKTDQEESPLKELIRSRRHQQHEGMEEEEEEDKAQDIRPKLETASDILGKIVPSTTLEWETGEEESTVPVRPTTFAGVVKSVLRVRKLQGHMNGIVCLCFDKKRLITGGMDRTVRVWDIRSGTNIHKFCGHKGGIRCLQFDNDILATGSWDMLIVLWDMRQFTKVTALFGHTGCVSCLKINRNYVVSGSHDSTIRVWSRKTYLCCQVIKVHTGAVSSLVLDGNCILSSSCDLTLCMSSMDTGHCVRVFDGVQKPILSLVIANDLVIGGDQTGSIYFWNKSTGESEAAIRAHDAPVHKVSYWKSRFWTASGDNTVKEWDLMTLTCVRALQGHKGPVRDVRVCDDRVVSCSDDGTIRIWDFEKSKTSSKKARR